MPRPEGPPGSSPPEHRGETLPDAEAYVPKWRRGREDLPPLNLNAEPLPPIPAPNIIRPGLSPDSVIDASKLEVLPPHEEERRRAISGADGSSFPTPDYRSSSPPHHGSGSHDSLRPPGGAGGGSGGGVPPERRVAGGENDDGNGGERTPRRHAAVEYFRDTTVALKEKLEVVKGLEPEETVTALQSIYEIPMEEWDAQTPVIDALFEKIRIFGGDKEFYQEDPKIRQYKDLRDAVDARYTKEDPNVKGQRIEHEDYEGYQNAVIAAFQSWEEVDIREKQIKFVKWQIKTAETRGVPSEQVESLEKELDVLNDGAASTKGLNALKDDVAVDNDLIMNLNGQIKLAETHGSPPETIDALRNEVQRAEAAVEEKKLAVKQVSHAVNVVERELSALGWETEDNDADSATVQQIRHLVRRRKELYDGIDSIKSLEELKKEYEKNAEGVDAIAGVGVWSERMDFHEKWLKAIDDEETNQRKTIVERVRFGDPPPGEILSQELKYKELKPVGEKAGKVWELIVADQNASDEVKAQKEKELYHELPVAEKVIKEINDLRFLDDETLDAPSPDGGLTKRERLAEVQSQLDLLLYVAEYKGYFKNMDEKLDLSFAEFRQQVIQGKFDAGESGKHSVEGRRFALQEDSEARRGKLLEAGFSNTAINRFKGLNRWRAEDAFNQMRDLEDQIKEYHEAYEKWQEGLVEGYDSADFPELELTGKLGLWNANFKEAQFRVQERNRHRKYIHELRKQTLYDADDYHVRLVLDPNTYTKEMFDIARKQYIDDLLYGSGKFDANKIMQQMDLLGRAIKRDGRKFYAEEDLKRLRQETEVQLLFHLAAYFSRIGHTENYAAIMDALADHEGPDRIDRIAPMYDGMVGYGISQLCTRRYMLMYNVIGHRGQQIGDRDAQDYMRSMLKRELVNDMLRHRVKGGRVGKQVNLDKLNKELTPEEFRNIFEEVELFNVLSKEDLEDFLDKEADKAGFTIQKELSPEDLVDKEADKARITAQNERKRFIALKRSEYEKKKQEFEQRKRDAESAADVAINYYYVSGKSAKQAAPTWQMKNAKEYRNGSLQENGDRIKVDDVIHFIKYAIMQTQKSHGRTIADIRKDASNKNSGNYDTDGLSPEERVAFKDAIRILERDGFKAKWGNERFEDIIDIEKHPEVFQVYNNFLAIDHPVRHRLTNPRNREEARKIEKGKVVDNRDGITTTEEPEFTNWFGRIIKTLDPDDKLLKDNFTSEQQRVDAYTDAIEASRAFHGTIWRMVHREMLNDVDRVEYGFANIPLATKRLMYYQAYLMTNQREKVSRAGALISELPLYLSSIDEEFSAKNLSEISFLYQKGAYDHYELIRYFMRVKSASAFKSMCEGGVSDKGERDWGLFEKPISTATRLWKVVTTPRGNEHQSTKEDYVTQGLALFERFTRLAAIVEKMYSGDRGASGSGAGKFEVERFWNAYINWVFSDQEGYKRIQGGLFAYKDAKNGFERIRTLRFHPDSEENTDAALTILDEMFRRLDPTHDPSIPSGSIS